jgi:uncharacterized protein YPO0396
MASRDLPENARVHLGELAPQVVHPSSHQVIHLALVPLVQRRQRHRAQHHCKKKIEIARKASRPAISEEALQ